MEGRGLVAELQRSVICPICRGPFKDPVLLDCDHSYCRACITGHWEQEGVLSCPHCQKVFERRSLRTHVKLAVEVKIAENLNAKTAQEALRSKPRRRRGGWIPVSVIPERQEEAVVCPVSPVPLVNPLRAYGGTILPPARSLPSQSSRLPGQGCREDLQMLT